MAERNVETIKIPTDRYEELVKKESRLELLETAIKNRESYSSLDEIKSIFGLEKE